MQMDESSDPGHKLYSKGETQQHTAQENDYLPGLPKKLLNI